MIITLRLHLRITRWHMIGLLAFGALLQWIAAWACAYTSATSMSAPDTISRMESLDQFNMDSEIGSAVIWEERGFGYQRDVATSLPAIDTQIDQTGGWLAPYELRRQIEEIRYDNDWGLMRLEQSLVDSAVSGWATARNIRAGWPMKSLSGNLVVQPVSTWVQPDRPVCITSTTLPILVDEGQRIHIVRGLPFVPIAFGFIINTVLYAGIGAILLCVVQSVHSAVWLPLIHRRRVRKGICPTCRYPLGDALCCSECGAEINT
jgi:hypothetical protein